MSLPTFDDLREAENACEVLRNAALTLLQNNENGRYQQYMEQAQAKGAGDVLAERLRERHIQLVYKDASYCRWVFHVYSKLVTAEDFLVKNMMVLLIPFKDRPAETEEMQELIPRLRVKLQETRNFFRERIARFEEEKNQIEAMWVVTGTTPLVNGSNDTEPPDEPTVHDHNAN